jgi:hypothetical protein
MQRCRCSRSLLAGMTGSRDSGVMQVPGKSLKFINRSAYRVVAVNLVLTSPAIPSFLSVVAAYVVASIFFCDSACELPTCYVRGLRYGPILRLPSVKSGFLCSARGLQ